MDDNDKKGNEEGSRARNRTVMLTPDVTSQVRTRLAQELGSEPAAAAAPLSRGGFEAPVRGQFGVSGSLSNGAGGQRALPDHSRSAPPALSRAAVNEEPAVETLEGVYWAKESPIVGFLVAYDRTENGEFYELRSGRIMVTTSVRAGENALVLSDDTVSPMHAILRIGAAGDIQVLDQLSEHGTAITNVDGIMTPLSGDKGDLAHGDTVSFGARTFYVCVVPRVHEPGTSGIKAE